MSENCIFCGTDPAKNTGKICEKCRTEMKKLPGYDEKLEQKELIEQVAKKTVDALVSAITPLFGVLAEALTPLIQLITDNQEKLEKLIKEGEERRKKKMNLNFYLFQIRLLRGNFNHRSHVFTDVFRIKQLQRWIKKYLDLMYPPPIAIWDFSGYYEINYLFCNGKVYKNENGKMVKMKERKSFIKRIKEKWRNRYGY
jgi:hypothetical protein